MGGRAVGSGGVRCLGPTDRTLASGVGPWCVGNVKEQEAKINSDLGSRPESPLPKTSGGSSDWSRTNSFLRADIPQRQK